MGARLARGLLLGVLLMSAQYRLLSFTSPSPSGNVTLTPGFEMKAFIAISTAQVGWGSFAEQSWAHLATSVGTVSRSHVLAFGWEPIFSHPRSARGVQPYFAFIGSGFNYSSNVLVSAAMLSVTATQFTIAFAESDGAYEYWGIAIGGDGVMAAQGTKTCPTVASTQPIAHGLGTAPTYVMLIGGQTGNSTSGSHLSIGHYDGMRQRVTAVHAFGISNGLTAGNSDVDSVQRPDSCLKILDDVTGAVIGDAAVTSVDATNINVDFSQAPLVGQDYSWLAIAGIDVFVGTLTQPAAPGVQTVEEDEESEAPISVAAQAALFQSFGQPASGSVVDAMRLSIGGSNGVENFAAFHGENDNLTFANRRAVRYNSNVAALVSAHPTSSSTGLVDAAGAVTNIDSAGPFEVTWSQVAAPAPEWIFVLFGPLVDAPEPEPELEDGGFELPGALAGTEGPLIGIEFHHPEIASPLVVSPIALADPVTWRYGFKEKRLLRVDTVQISLSEKAGQPQANRLTFEIADKIEGDTAPIVRSWLGQIDRRALWRVEIVAWMITDRDRRRFRAPVTIFRGRIEEYQGLDGFRTRIECLSWGHQRFDEAVLKDKVGDLFPNAPVETRDLLLPLGLGPLSDEASGEAGPIIVEDDDGTGSVAGADPIAGYGQLPGAAPTGVVASEEAASGNLNFGLVPGNTFYISATRIVAGVEGNRSPLVPAEAVAVTITADGAGIRAQCNDDGPGTYRFHIGRNFFGVKFQHSLDTLDPVTGVRFTDFPPLGAEVPVTPGAVRGSNAQAWAKVVAILPGGRSLPSDEVYLATTGNLQPVRFAWLAVPDAEEYEVYWRDHPTNAFQRRYMVATSHVNDNGDPYVEIFWDATTGFELVSGLPAPKGMVVPRYVGMVNDLAGVPWGGFLMSVRPGTTFHAAYFDGVRINEGEYGVQIVAPGKPGYSTNFGADPFYTVGDFRLFMVFLRGPLLQAALNASIPPEDLPATSASATIGSGASEVRVEVVEPGTDGNAYFISVTQGVGLSQPLLASLAGDVVIVILATDGAGDPDDAANTAIKVAQVLNGVHGLRAGVTGDGTGVVAEQALQPFGGGADEGQTPGAQFTGEFRVNFDGCDDEDDGSGDCITDKFDLLMLLLKHLFLKNTPSMAGPWDGSMPTFFDGRPRMDAAAFAQAKLDHQAIVPSGRNGGRWIADDITWAELIAEWSLSAGAKTGLNEEGEFTVAVRNPSATPVAAVDHVLEILEGSFSFADSARGYATRTPYAFQPVYDAGGSFELAETPPERTAPARAAEYDRDIPDDRQDYVWIKSGAVARQLAKASLLASQHPPREVQSTSVLHWLHLPIGRAIAVTHPEGPTAAGYQRDKLQILGKRIDPHACTVSLVLDELRAGELEVSIFVLEEFMGTTWVGGSRHDSTVEVATDVVRPIDGFTFRIDWDAVPETHGIQVRIELQTTVGAITPGVWVDGSLPPDDAAVVEGDAEGGADMESQVQTLLIPRAEGEVDYVVYGRLAGGATPEDCRMHAVREAVQV